VRRCAELGDAWHPLGLSLDDVEKGLATLSQMATRAGRGKGPGLSPRNLLDLADRPKGSGRASFQGSPDEVASDVRRAQKLGAEWMTFDLPRVDVPGMMRAMERLVKEVKPAVS
jgi:alkanesulfonate monooxygenase SsuD/methylene tetrahydromethanopterin reductase-like flavin-dependent oxidoreductase (luciferase family)